MEYGKETNDGVWRASLEKRKDSRWSFQQYKKWGKEGDAKWEPMGYEQIFLARDVAELTLSRLGYLPVD